MSSSLVEIAPLHTVYGNEQERSGEAVWIRWFAVTFAVHIYYDTYIYLIPIVGLILILDRCI